MSDLNEFRVKDYCIQIGIKHLIESLPIISLKIVSGYIFSFPIPEMFPLVTISSQSPL